MAKTKKRKNPSAVITNKGGKKNGKKRASGFFGRLMNRATEDGKIAAGCYLGGEIGQVGAELGTKYLSKTAGKFAVPAGQLGLWYVLFKVKASGFARWLRIGVLEEAIRGAVARQGYDPAGMILKMIPGSGGVQVGATESSGAKGLGAMRDRRAPMTSRFPKYNSALGF